MAFPLLFSIIGAFTGLIISQILYRNDISDVGFFLMSGALLVILFGLIWKKQTNTTLIKGLLGMAVVLFGLSTWHVINKDIALAPLLFLSLIEVTVVCAAFLQSWQPNKPHFVYGDLFENAWNNHFFLIFSGVLSVGFLIILGLGGQLFDSIGIEASKFIWGKNILPIIIATLIGAGIGISREHSGLIFKIRSVFFAIFRAMAYLAATIVILFSISLPFYFDALFSNKNTSAILLSIVAISILLLNTLLDISESIDDPDGVDDSSNIDNSKEAALSKDGSAEIFNTQWKSWIFSIQIILLPFLSLLAVYAISLRIAEYGLMPRRIIALSIAVLISIYTLSYLYQLIKRKKNWAQGLAIVNPPLAMLFVLTLIALGSPVLDPVRMSINSQVERLRSGTINPKDFDFSALRHYLGKRGKIALKDIKTWKNHPQFSAIEKYIKLKKKNKKVLLLEVIGTSPAHLDKLKSQQLNAWSCNQEKRCYLKQIHLATDSDKLHTVVFHFVEKHVYKAYDVYAELYTYKEEDGLWLKDKSYSYTPYKQKGPKTRHGKSLITKETMEQIISKLKQDQQKTIQPLYNDIEVDGIQLR